MIGSVSDNTHSRFGRRIPFIIIFVPLAAIGFAILPLLVQPGLLWGFVAVLLFTTVALALFRAPVIALMPDITPSQFRSQGNGLINLMGGIGGILAFAAGAYLYGLNRVLPFFCGSGSPGSSVRDCRFGKSRSQRTATLKRLKLDLA